MEQDFVHLRMHSEYSVKDSMIRVKQIVHTATAAGMKALALTDLSVMFGHIFFYKACLGQGIKPIFGVDAWIANPSSPDQPFRMLLLCRNNQGYHKICEWLSKAWMENQVDGRGLIDPSWFNKEDCDGMICLSGFDEGPVGRALLNNKKTSAMEEAEKYAALFPDRFYLELQRAGRRHDEQLVGAMLQLSCELDLPVVATHPIQFPEKSDFEAHEIRCCIAQSTTLANPNRPKIFSPEQYFKTREEMLELFKDIPDAIENTCEIAKRCTINLILGKPQLPLFKTPDGISLDDYMAQLAREGLDMRLAILYPDEKKRKEVFPQYSERLEREIKVIQTMGFSGYFLIVQDFIRWAKGHGCPVGPGRGSGAGSLVAFSLEITDLDPLEFNLLFERFLNPERVSMPDFDVDFCQNNRERVIEYVKQRYGSDAVSQIATFGTMAAKGVIKDVGRVLDFGYNETDRLAKFIPAIPGQNPTLESAINSEPDFKRLLSNSPEYKQLITAALKIQGLTRNIGIHAGGVLIAPGKLTDFCPLYDADMLPENVISMYDKKEVEEAGLVKFDFLGLTTLTILDRALDYIEKNTGKRPDIAHLIPNDKKVYDDIFKKADTAMVFQFESPGMQSLMVRAVPTKLSDLIALNALYRPGPMDLADDFIALRNGEQTPEYADDRLKPVLEETSGIMIYQEQVMQVAQIIAGYSLGGADILRRAMGKKDAAEMERQSKVFLDGAVKNGVKAEVAQELFNKMRKFAEYGFNKSHAAAYSYVAYQTAWLKCYYPAEFIASNLCEVLNNGVKQHFYIGDAIRHGIKVLGPDINESEFYFTSPDSKTIRFGFGAIKGMGIGPADAIVAERKAHGPYKDIFDLAQRVGPKQISRKILEVLSLSGAFDSIDPNRNMWLANVPKAYQNAQEADDARDQMNLFGDEGSSVEEIWLKPKPWYPIRAQMEEKSVLGFLFSSSPVDVYREEITQRLHGRTMSQLTNPGNKRTDFVAYGQLVAVQPGVSKKGEHFCKITIDDGFDRYEMRVVPELYEYARYKLMLDELYCIHGTYSCGKDGFTISYQVRKIEPISRIRAMQGARLEIEVAKDASAKAVRELLTPAHHSDASENCKVVVVFKGKEAHMRLPLGEDVAIQLTDQAVSDIASSDLIESVQIAYA